MKILIATGLYPPESGGPATFAKLAEDELGKKGFEITTVPFSRVRQYPKLIRHFVYFFLLLKHCKQKDVILALDAVSVGMPAAILAKVKKLPLIVRLGGDYAWEQGRQRFGVTSNLDDFSNETKVPFGVKVFQYIQTKVTKSADRVIAPSNYLKSIIAKWGVPEENIEVVYSVSYLSKAIDEKPVDSENLSLENKRPILFSIGRLVPWKGFEVLLDLVNDLKTKYPDILLLIGGDGPQAGQLNQKINSLNLHNHVKLLGLLKRNEIETLSQKVDLFVLNTEYEGFSHQLVECMQLGMPIITTRVGGNPELVKHDENGYLVAYNDTEAIKQAISTLTENPAIRERYIQSAKERVKEFSKEKSVEKLQSVFNDVVKK